MAIAMAVAALAIGVGPAARSAATGTYGDVNCDGRIDSIDALLVLQYSASLIGLLPVPCFSNADLDGDVDLTAIDATLILQFQAGLVPELGPHANNGSAVAIGAGDRHTCAVTTDGAVKCWGENGSGALGNGTTQDRRWPDDVASLGSGVTAISAGLDASCALTTGGVKCWGWNEEGQLGDGSVLNRLSPIDVTGLSSGVSAIAMGGTHACAIMSAGGVKCWGGNASGELGATTSQSCTRFNFPCSSVPVDVVGLNTHVAAIALGAGFACVLNDAGGVKCWGGNGYGQLGDGTRISRSTPADVLGLTTGASAIATGDGFACAALLSGEVKCWGRNAYAQLGTATAEQCEDVSCSTTPVEVANFDDAVTTLTAGTNHVCAIVSGGSVKCWGGDGLAVLGGQGTNICANSVPCSYEPLAVVGLDDGVSAVAAGGYHSCALLESGGVRCWGSNGFEELGAKSIDCTFPQSCSLVPIAVVGFGGP